MLDFLFRRGNPTNGWTRSQGLMLAAALDVPALTNVALGSHFDHLSFLGRNDRSEFGSLCYFDLGIGIEYSESGTFDGFMIVLADEDKKFRSYAGTLSWNRKTLNLHQLTIHDLPSVFGDWYWLDSDEFESIAFYEFPAHEMQIELSLSGAIKRFILTKNPIMADPDQRKAYGVNKTWPPEYGM